ncbi:hypothetical protein KAX97_10770 [candidate division WOR-3 bacterium]|nr:hypothetical protein [candidate division WOR-3 bacterium]
MSKIYKLELREFLFGESSKNINSIINYLYRDRVEAVDFILLRGNKEIEKAMQEANGWKFEIVNEKGRNG